MGRADQRVLSHMNENGGVLTRSSALALGMPSSTLQEWVRVGHIVNVGKGLYVLPGVLQSEATLLRAATSALDAVVSHESAARLHGIAGLGAAYMAVSVPVRRSNRFPGLTVHQLTDLAPEHVLSISGMPTTNLPRTISDLAAVLPEKLLASCADQAVRLGATYEQQAEMLDELSRRGKPGMRKLRKILEVRLGRNLITESVLESRLLAVILGGGLPAPTTQFRPPWLRKVNGRVDMAYVEQEVLVEGDSQLWHNTPEAFQIDTSRDNLAALAGWISLRFTWDDLTNRPAMVVSQIEQALSIRVRAGYPAPQH